MKCRTCDNDIPQIRHGHTDKEYCSQRCQKIGYRTSHGKTCRFCGGELPSSRHQICEDCQTKARAEANRIRSIRRNHEIKLCTDDQGQRKITVFYPGVALPDHWTSHEFELYQNDLPPGCQVEVA